jgi:hypothetical protein
VIATLVAAACLVTFWSARGSKNKRLPRSRASSGRARAPRRSRTPARAASARRACSPSPRPSKSGG